MPEQRRSSHNHHPGRRRSNDGGRRRTQKRTARGLLHLEQEAALSQPLYPSSGATLAFSCSPSSGATLVLPEHLFSKSLEHVFEQPRVAPDDGYFFRGDKRSSRVIIF